MAEPWSPTAFATVLLLLLLAGGAAASASASTLEVSLMKNANANEAPSSSSSWASSIAAQTSRDASRVLYLASLASSAGGAAPLASGRQLLHTQAYLVRASLGTPPQRLLLAVDTSNDAAWVPCAGCHGCPTTSPTFNPSSSATFRAVPCGAPPCSQAPNPSCSNSPSTKSRPSCGFSLSYGDSSLEATLSQDNLAVTPSGGVLKGYTFGCLARSNGSAAPVLGLGRGPLGFVAQTKGVYGGVFSYCLPSYYGSAANFSGSLTLGREGQPEAGKTKTTPLLASPHRPSLYYVAMAGVRVGRKAVAIPAPALRLDAATGAGGTVLDSGTMFARLAPPAYAAVRDEVRRRVAARSGGRAPVSSLGGLDTCYNVSAVAWPAVTLVFGGGMEVRLPEENVVIRSTYGATSCLAMAASPAGGVDAALNVIGSLQQQNHRVLFDVPNARVGFARERCTAAAAA